MMKPPLSVLTSLSHEAVPMRMEIDFLSERLYDGYHAWSEFKRVEELRNESFVATHDLIQLAYTAGPFESGYRSFT